MKETIGISKQGEQMIRNFIDVLSTQKTLSAKTLKEYASDLKHFIGWFETAVDAKEEEAAFRIENVVTSTLIDYREAMQQTMELKPATINRRLITLKKFFEWAVAEAKVKCNPSKSVKLLPEQKARPRQMTDLEEAALLAVTEQYGSLRDRTIVLAMVHTGLRTMEVCDLAPGDIHINEHHSVVTVRSKIRNNPREVPLNAVCEAALKNYASKFPPDARYLFASEKTGGRLTERALRHLIQKYMRAAGIEGLRAIDLRHRFGYVMAETTALHRLAQMMGHDNLNTTMLYVKTNRTTLQTAVKV